MPAIPAAIAIGTIAAAGAGIAGIVSSASQAAAAKKAAAAAQNVQPNASQTVGDNSTTNPDQLGRAALIATSPSGVLGTDPTGRRQLLGND